MSVPVTPSDRTLRIATKPAIGWACAHIRVSPYNVSDAPNDGFSVANDFDHARTGIPEQGLGHFYQMFYCAQKIADRQKTRKRVNQHVYLKLMIDGKRSLPFSAQTLPPLCKCGDEAQKDILISVSRERFARRRDEIETKIEKWISG